MAVAERSRCLKILTDLKDRYEKSPLYSTGMANEKATVLKEAIALIEKTEVPEESPASGTMTVKDMGEFLFDRPSEESLLDTKLYSQGKPVVQVDVVPVAGGVELKFIREYL